LDRHYKIGPSTDHRAKFHAGPPTHLGDLVLKKINKTSGVKLKSSRKLSLPGGLIKSQVVYLLSYLLTKRPSCGVHNVPQGWPVGQWPVSWRESTAACARVIHIPITHQWTSH